MRRRRHIPEQVVRKLLEADRMLGEGAELADVCRHLEVSESTFHRCRNQYGGMKADDTKRLKEVERENTRLKRIVADKDLEITALREVAKDAPIYQAGQRCRRSPRAAPPRRRRDGSDPHSRAKAASDRGRSALSPIVTKSALAVSIPMAKVPRARGAAALTSWPSWESSRRISSRRARAPSATLGRATSSLGGDRRDARVPASSFGVEWIGLASHPPQAPVRPGHLAHLHALVHEEPGETGSIGSTSLPRPGARCRPVSLAAAPR